MPDSDEDADGETPFHSTLRTDGEYYAKFIADNDTEDWPEELLTANEQQRLLPEV